MNRSLGLSSLASAHSATPAKENEISEKKTIRIGLPLST
jgi:hypothetical protein